MFSGYLNAEEQPRLPGAAQSLYRLSIPNMEVRLVYTGTFHDWMDTRLRKSGGDKEAGRGSPPRLAGPPIRRVAPDFRDPAA